MRPIEASQFASESAADLCRVRRETLFNVQTALHHLLLHHITSCYIMLHQILLAM